MFAVLEIAFVDTVASEGSVFSTGGKLLEHGQLLKF